MTAGDNKAIDITDKSQVFSVLVNQIIPEKVLPFPVYIYLKLNDSYVCLCNSGGMLEKARFAIYEAKLSELWIPNDYKDAFDRYLAALNTKEMMAEPQELFRETNIVHDLMTSKSIHTSKKTEALSRLSSIMLQSLKIIDSPDPVVKKKALEKCTQVADEILLLASLSNSTFEEIIQLRNAKEMMDHSVATGTIAVMFAMALGVVDEEILGELAMAALLHDIGLFKIPVEIALKAEQELTEEEFEIYKTHVAHSVRVLTQSDLKESNVLRLIAEHHENHDGSGFPKGLKGDEIDDISEILHLADWFEHLSAGKITGKALSPQTCFDILFESIQRKDATKVVRPELIEMLYQAMQIEKRNNQKQAVERELDKATAALKKS